MADPKWKIQGRVIDLRTGLGIPRLVVEAWDKDAVSPDDRLGESRPTNRDGDFQIEFARSRFADEVIDACLLQLYFRVRRGEHEYLECTWPTVVPSTAAGTIKTLLQLAAPAPAPPETEPARPDATEVTIEDAFVELPTMGPVAPPPMAPSRAGALQDTIETTVAQVLGTEYQRDGATAFRQSLDRAFTPEEVEGHVEYRWTRPSSAPIASEQAGQLSAEQAVLYNRAKQPLTEALQTLQSLEPLRPDADEDTTAACQAIVRVLLLELVEELGREVLVEAHVDHLLQQLGEQWDQLVREFGIDPRLVKTLVDNERYTKGLQLNYYIKGLQAAWKEYLQRPTHGQPSLGEQIALLSQALDAVVEATHEVVHSLARASIGPHEQEVIFIEFAGGDRPVSVGGLLRWVRGWAESEARDLMRQGGRLGIEALARTARQLRGLVAAAVDAKVSHPGYHRPRVRRSLLELAANLREVERLAGAAKTEIPSAYTR